MKKKKRTAEEKTELRLKRQMFNLAKRIWVLQDLLLECQQVINELVLERKTLLKNKAVVGAKTLKTNPTDSL